MAITKIPFLYKSLLRWFADHVRDYSCALLLNIGTHIQIVDLNVFVCT